MRIRILHRTVAASAIAIAVTSSALAAELPSLNAAIGESSISGISSGAFMAIQFGTAWSSVIKGVGAIAGGPYWCAEADLDDAVTWFSGPIARALGSCMTGRPPSDLQLGDFTGKADDEAKSGDIDPLANIARQKIYLFHGTNDKIVARASTDVAADFYRHYLGGGRRQPVLSNHGWSRPFPGRPAGPARRRPEGLQRQREPLHRPLR